MSFEIKIENKLKRQIEHLFCSYEGEELKAKVYDLAFEVHLKSFNEGVKCMSTIEERNKK